MGLFDSLGAAVSGLNGSTAALQTVQHNIANANTEGFSRQRVEFVTTSPQPLGKNFLGNGVAVGAVSRIFDSLVLQQLQTSTSAFKLSEALLQNSEQIDNILAEPGTGVSGGLNDLFRSANGVADDPSNFGARETLFTEVATLAARFNGLDAHFDSLRTSVNSEVRTFVSDVNQLAIGIAELNTQILAFPLNSQPNDLLDQRDQLITRLSEQVSVTTAKQTDGSLSVFIGNGQALVLGTEASTLATQVNRLDANNLDITVTDGNFVTDITNQIAGGKIGGILTFRETVLNRAQNTVGQIAVALADQMNNQHRLGQDLNGNLGGDLFTLPSVNVNADTANVGATVVTGTFGNTTNLTPSDYSLIATGANTFTLTRLDDNTQTAINTGGVFPFTTAEVDGFTLTISAASVANDDFLIQPTRNAGGEIARAVNTSREIASALPLRVSGATNANGLGTNTGNGAVNNLTISSVANLPLTGAPVTVGNVALNFDAATNQFNLVPDVLGDGPLAYNPATDSGTTFTILGGVTFTVNGTPANTDAFILTDNTGGVSDNGNALLLANLQTVQSMNNATSTFGGTDGQLVTTIGTLTRSASISEEANEALFFQATERREAVSGVNLDEEAANLVRFQQAFQANAQVISITTTLFDTLLSVT